MPKPITSSDEMIECLVKRIRCVEQALVTRLFDLPSSKKNVNEVLTTGNWKAQLREFWALSN